MIKLQNIDFGYTREKMLFNNLTLSVNAGCIYGLLGKNGAGKTTLLKIITGLRQPDKGVCNVLGYQPFVRETQFLEQLYIVPEELCLPPVSIKNYIKQFAGFYPWFSQEALFSYMNSFDIEKDMHLGRVSYGQKKKFALSFAMATGARLVLFDEPTNGLDIPSKSIFRKLAASAVTDERTFIISTHQVRDLNLLIEEVLLLSKGSVLLNCSVPEIAKRYSFVTLPRNHVEQNLIYSEDHIEGIRAIVPYREGYETEVDLEMLFNATIFGKISVNHP